MITLFRSHQAHVHVPVPSRALTPLTGSLSDSSRPDTPLSGDLHADIKRITDSFFAPGPIVDFLGAFVRGEKELPVTKGSIRGLPSAWRRGFGKAPETRPSLLFMDLPDTQLAIKEPCGWLHSRACGREQPTSYTRFWRLWLWQDARCDRTPVSALGLLLQRAVKEYIRDGFFLFPESDPDKQELSLAKANGGNEHEEVRELEDDESGQVDTEEEED
ncbi:hypothetical protein B0O80DRAFT_425891 [Mortierella sp. GBAus27b]|nr:hypothetical protein B0O80DRAFT_425891 [Mortierella sp. GBAus27b]